MGKNIVLKIGFWILLIFRVEEKEGRRGIVEGIEGKWELYIVLLKLRKSFDVVEKVKEC